MPQVIEPQATNQARTTNEIGSTHTESTPSPLVVAINPAIKQRLKVEAARRNETMTSLVERLLSDWLAAVEVPA